MRKSCCTERFHFLFITESKKKFLLQKRAVNKYHSGGLWTNSCCSHPRHGEELREAVVRRTKDELGLNILQNIDALKEVGKFQYYKKFNACAENEIDHVFFLPVDENIEVRINTDEIEDVKWLSVEDISKNIKCNLDLYTAWFPQAYGIIMKYLDSENL